MKSEVALAFGQALRQIRKTAGLTQEELGLSAGLQRKYVSSLELGEKQPTLTTIFKLAQALKIRPAMLLDLTEECGQQRLQLELLPK